MDTQNKKILIGEDEKPLAKALELKLGSSGYDVKIAFDGEEVLAILATEIFDLVLLDLMMPKKDGFAVLEELQQKGIKVPVIVTSNLSQEEDIIRVKKLGAIDYMVKSNTQLNQIVAKIQEILSQT